MNSLMLLGPLGLGYQLSVDSMPAEDSGCFCESYQRTIVWDAPLVSLHCGAECEAQLVTNHLGSMPDALAIRDTLSRHRVAHSEVGQPPTTTPADFVISARNRASRTWFSTIRPPTLLDLASSVAISPSRPDGLYSDHWLGIDELPNYVALLHQQSPRLIWYNVGDWSDVSQLPYICNQFTSASTIVQVSLKSSVETSLLSSLLTTFAIPDNVRLILTRGGHDIISKTAEAVNVLPVERITGHDTAGAGAHFAAAFLLAHFRDPNRERSQGGFLDLVAHSRDTATRQIRNATASFGVLV